MAIQKSTIIDKIEIVGQHKAVQVRTATLFIEDGKTVSRSTNRYVLHPHMDVSDQPDEVRVICEAAWTDEVTQAWADFQAAQAALRP